MRSNRSKGVTAGDRNEMKRHAAVLMLKELTLNAPTVMYAFVAQILDYIWLALRDAKASDLLKI